MEELVGAVGEEVDIWEAGADTGGVNRGGKGSLDSFATAGA